MNNLEYLDRRMKRETKNTKQKGDIFELICINILLTLGFFKDVWLRSKVPQNIRRELGMSSLDFGDDIICTDHDGAIYICQAKYRSSKNIPIHKADVDPMLERMALMCRYLKEKDSKISVKGCIFMTTMNKTSKMNKWFSGWSNFVDLFTRESFINRDVSIRTSIDDAFKGIVKQRYLPRKPLNCQLRALQKVEREFKKRDRTTVQMICGSGKTYLACLVSKGIIDQIISENDHGTKIVLYVFPRLRLMDQNIHEIFNFLNYHYPDLFNFIVVGSKTEHGIFQKTTDSAEIKARSKDKLTCIFSTYDSLEKVLSVRSKNIRLAIFDEAHNIQGRLRTKEPMSSLEKIKGKCLFLTATPKSCKNSNYTSSLDKTMFGRICFTYFMDEAIKDQRIVDYSVFPLFVSDQDILNTKVKIEKDGFKSLLHANIIYHAITIWNRKKQLVVCQSIATAKRLTTDLKNLLLKKDLNDIVVVNINTNTAKNIYCRNNKERKFLEAEISVLISVDMYREGIDRPEIDAVVILKNIYDKAAIIQCLCRALRLYQYKFEAHIYIPVITEDPSDYVGCNDYKMLIKTLEELAEYDSTMTFEKENFFNRFVPGSKKIKSFFISRSNNKPVEDEEEINYEELFDSKLFEKFLSVPIHRKIKKGRVNQNWTIHSALLRVICAVCDRETGLFTSKQIKYEKTLKHIHTLTSKTPNNSMNAALQFLRDQKYIEFVDYKGRYKLIAVEVPSKFSDDTKGWEDKYRISEFFMKEFGEKGLHKMFFDEEENGGNGLGKNLDSSRRSIITRYNQDMNGSRREAKNCPQELFEKYISFFVMDPIFD